MNCQVVLGENYLQWDEIETSKIRFIPHVIQRNRLKSCLDKGFECESDSFYLVFVENIHGYRNHSHFETNFILRIFSFCVEPSAFNHSFGSNQGTSVLAQQLRCLSATAGRHSLATAGWHLPATAGWHSPCSQLPVVSLFSPLHGLLVTALSIARILGNQAVRNY